VLQQLFDPILATVYPQSCYVCGGPVDAHSDGVACGECWSVTQIFDGSESLCVKCGAILKFSKIEAADRCGDCDDGSYDSAFAAGVYEKALAATVVNLKEKPHLPKRARLLLGDLVERVAPNSNSVVIPVPLSERRRFERGHNQSEVIAQIFADNAGIPSYTHVLSRNDHTPMHRIGMDKKARAATVKNSFEVQAPRLIAGKDVLLVDDVFTSGSTASYCSHVLKKSGAARVTVVTLARAVMYT
jgi:ComF family protein